MKLVCAALLTLFFSNAALAQTPGIGETRPLPPLREDPPPALGDSQQSRPDVRAPTPEERDATLIRCPQPVGAPREECLREERSAAGGATRSSEPPTAPPPQNPR